MPVIATSNLPSHTSFNFMSSSHNASTRRHKHPQVVTFLYSPFFLKEAAMEPSKFEPLVLPSQPRNYIVLRLPFNLPRLDSPRRNKILKMSLIILAITATLYAIWPSEPDVHVARMRLRHFRIHTKPHIAIDVAFDATVKVGNRAIYSMNYNSLHVAIGYRGKELGHVISGGGYVRPLGSSYVDATVEFDGVEVISDWIYLLDDLAKGCIQFEAVTQVDGSFALFFVYHVPLKVTPNVKISCEIDVNINRQTVTRQSCYPELEH